MNPNINEKSLINSQIDKIFSIMESNDDQGICKIAMETLSNKCYDNPSFLYPIFKNLVGLIKKGNLRLIEESKFLIDSIFEEFDHRTIEKIFRHEEFQKQIESSNVYTVNLETNLQILRELELCDASVMSKYEIFSHLEHLYSKDETNKVEGVTFSKMEIEVLFPDKDDIRKEIEECMNVKGVKKNNLNNAAKFKKSKMKIKDFYQMSCNKISLPYHFELNKKRKLDDGTELNLCEIIFNPMLGMINEVLLANSSLSWKARLCSITLLNYMKEYLPKVLYTFYKLTVTTNKGNVEDVTVNESADQSFEISLREDLSTRLILNSLIDKVVDFGSSDGSICIFKELNLSFASGLLQNLNLKTTEIVLKLLEDCLSDSECDWQVIFTLLTATKYFLEIENSEKVYSKLFHLIHKLMHIDSEEVINLTIQILDKLLGKTSSLTETNDNLSSIFPSFLNLINNYDDIGSGVKFYFNCLYNFIIYFISKGELSKFYSILMPILENEFIFFSLNKITSVRIKYFEVMYNLLDCDFSLNFSNDFMEKNILLAYQGQCIETDKELLSIQQKFLVKTIISHVNIFSANNKKFLKLLMKENYTDLAYFYIPHNDKYERSEVEAHYTSFFINSTQVDMVNTNFTRKLHYVVPLFSLLMKQKVEFIQIILNFFKINLGNEPVISQNLFVFCKIYLHYLELIESNPNKMLILTDDYLKILSDNNTVNDIPVQIPRKEIETNLGIVFKFFLDHVNKFNQEDTEADLMKLNMIYDTLNEKNILQTKEVTEIMKSIYEKIKTRSKLTEENLKNLCDNFMCLKRAINMIETQYQNVKNRIRGYSSACLFLHNLFMGVKIERCSSIVNSFLNCLKSNKKESKIFTVYLTKLLFTIGNPQTVGKILSTLIENSIKMYTDDHLHTDKGKFIPIKAFFGEFAKFQKYSDIHQIIMEYHTQAGANSEGKIIILLYLITFIKHDVKCIEYEQFAKIISTERRNDFIFLIATIIKNYKKIFSNVEDVNVILSTLFTQIQTGDEEEKLFFLRIIEELQNDAYLLISSANYLFDILKLINSKTIPVRTSSISLFSRIMKIISVLKQNSTLDGITNNNSLNFLMKLFNQNAEKSSMLDVKLKENLRSYQITGINWLNFMGSYGLGVALCDDMGLGKTIQTLVAVVTASREYKLKHNLTPVNLIVCPNTLMLNWISEGKKFFDEREVRLIKIDNSFPHTRNNSSVLEIYVTSYDKVRENCNEIFTSQEYFYLVLDEAHVIKNPKTKIYQSIRKLESQRRIILTGTPIQNNVMELWALFDFLMPGFLGEENDFEIKYHKKIHSNIKKLNLEEKLQENIFQTSLLEIRKRIKPFILRRLKTDVLKELPEKIIQDYVCEMLPVQKQIYSYWEKVYNQTNQKKGEESCKILKLVDRLRKICNYPGLLGKEELAKILDEKTFSSISTCVNSGKLKSLEDLLVSLNFDSPGREDMTYANENKVLIFSQYKTMIEIIVKFLYSKFPKLNIKQITSDMKIEERAKVVDQFNADPSINILLLTTSVGGLGLSLTSANIVIMFDHDWNPMKDLQAIDRAHRIGQKKTVEVFRLITADSIEEKLISLQTFKKYIASNVVDEAKIHETGINANNFMESLEEFSNNQKSNKKSNKTNKKKNNIIDEEDDETVKEEIELEYLKKFI